MKQPQSKLALAGLLLATVACQAAGPTILDPALARDADMLELTVDSQGAVVEIEYHIDHEAVPIAIRSAFNQIKPGVTPVSAEHEFSGGDEYWELAAYIGGLKVEAMFRGDGTLVSEEIEVTTNSVAEKIRDAVDMTYPGASYGQWEMIRDGQGNTTEFHVKFEQDGKHHKVAVSLNGEILGTWFEIPAEIEVPLGS